MRVHSDCSKQQSRGICSYKAVDSSHRYAAQKHGYSFVAKAYLGCILPCRCQAYSDSYMGARVCWALTFRVSSLVSKLCFSQPYSSCNMDSSVFWHFWRFLCGFLVSCW